MKDFIKILTAIAIAAVSSWITVQLSRHKFQTERWWEKKVAAYESVIEAFHKSKKFSIEHMKAVEIGSEMNELYDLELRKLAEDAREEISKARDIGSFILSEVALDILACYETESINAPREDTWYDCLQADFDRVNKYMKEFIAEAKLDLKKF